MHVSVKIAVASLAVILIMWLVMNTAIHFSEAPGGLRTIDGFVLLLPPFYFIARLLKSATEDLWPEDEN